MSIFDLTQPGHSKPLHRLESILHVYRCIYNIILLTYQFQDSKNLLPPPIPLPPPKNAYKTLADIYIPHRFLYRVFRASADHEPTDRSVMLLRRKTIAGALPRVPPRWRRRRRWQKAAMAMSAAGRAKRCTAIDALCGGGLSSRRRP